MKDVCKRFNIKIDLDTVKKNFRDRINNILFHGLIFNNKDFDLDNLTFDFCNKFPLKYQSLNSFEDEYLSDSLKFENYLLRLQCLLDVLYEETFGEEWSVLAELIDEAINKSALDLGIKLKFTKTKGAQIYLVGSKFLDEKLVDDVLGVLEDKNKSAIRMAFEKGLQEYFESRGNQTKLRNVIRDMQVACDEAIKFLFNDKNLGFKHLFKDKRWEKVGLNEYQKRIFWNLNEYIDKLVKHKADSKILFEDAENAIYLVGMFIRLVLLK